MSKSSRASVKLEIYSDVICPWCYVGKARLDEAQKMLGDDIKVEIEWKPFELNPTMPIEGTDRKSYLMHKFGSADTTAMQTKLNDAGEPDGIHFNFDKMTKVPNTFKAHRLLWFAYKKGVQHHLSDVLFRKYFTQGLDLGDDQNLLAAATEVGIDETEVRAFLASDTGTGEVEKEAAVGRNMGINSVPSFVIDGQVVAAGAQPAKDLAEMFKRVVSVST